MTSEFYFDTSIWLDFYEKRGKNGENALQLIMKIIKKDLITAYSDLTIKELKHLNYSQNQINEIFSIVKLENIKRIHIYKEQREEASKLAKIRNVPKRDALHAILSRDNHLQLISRDRHFEKLKDISKAGLPEEFI